MQLQLLEQYSFGETEPYGKHVVVYRYWDRSMMKLVISCVSFDAYSMIWENDSDEQHFWCGIFLLRCTRHVWRPRWRELNLSRCFCSRVLSSGIFQKNHNFFAFQDLLLLMDAR